MSNKRIIFILVLAILLHTACALINTESYSFIPIEYRDKVKKSLDQAGNNKDELIKVLKTLQGPKQKSASFIIATMPFPDLISIKAEYLLEHIDYVHKIKDKYHWMKNMPEDIFLAYVLPYRVAEEPITPHRKYFYEQLDPRIKDSKTMLEVVYKVNVWLGKPRKDGTKRIRFVQTEARDQSPLSTLLCGYGRCEEMMIACISALRSVGIPARNVWTPYWTTCDNNHAWTEVWANGKWYPIESCSANIKCALPQTAGRAWFTKRASVAATIFAPRFGEPPDKTTVYKSDEKSSIINVLSNYSQTCNLNVTVVDQNNKPFTNTPVAVSVVNWGGFQAISRKNTDKEGKAKFTVGVGQYLLSAGKNDLSSWEIITTEPDKDLKFTMKLKKDNYPEGYFTLKYRDQNDAYNAFNPKSKDKQKVSPHEYLKQLDSEHNPLSPPETAYHDKFNPDKNPQVIELIKDHKSYNFLIKVLQKAGGNWPQISGAIKEVNESERYDLLQLISRLNQLDTLEITKEILLDHVHYANLARDHLEIKLTDDMFYSYVMSHALPYMHIYNWRRDLYEMFLPVAGKDRDILSMAKKINKWIEENIELLEVKGGRFFCHPNPATLLKSGKGTTFSLALATVAVLRSIGIPARIKSTWVEFFDGEKWQPMYPKDSKNITKIKQDKDVQKQYVKKGGLRIVTTKGGISFSSKDQNCTIASFRNGSWTPFRRREIAAQGGWMSVPPGDYLVTAASRNSNGDSLIYAKHVKLESGKGIILKVPLDLPLDMMTKKNMVIRNLKKLPDFTLTDRTKKEYRFKKSLKDKNILLVFFTLDSEPSIRMLPMIESTKNKARDAGIDIWTILIDEKAQDNSRIAGFSLPLLLDKEQSVIKQFIPKFADKKNEIMPSILLIDKTGKIVFWKEGYDLTIASTLEDVYAVISGKTPQNRTIEQLANQVKIKPIESLTGLECARKGLDYLQAGDYKKSVDQYRQAVKDIPDSSGIWYNYACALSRNNNIDEAFDALEKAIKFGYSDFDWMKDDPDLENIRQDKRFKQIVTKK